MISVLDEIIGLRTGAPMEIDCRNYNRYRVVIEEQDGSKTAYYFSTPVYNNKTGKLVDMKFHENGGKIYSIGSNASCTFTDHVKMENEEGICRISLDEPVIFEGEQAIRCHNHYLHPTLNGFAYQISFEGASSYSFDMEVERAFMGVRANDKCFCLMSEHFRPFVTVSGIGTMDRNGEVIAPAKITYQKLTDRKYRFTVTSCSPKGRWIWVEINFYEAKLIQDTTVESANPKMNNAFGGTAFIGHTPEFGEQWLYTRLDFSKMSELTDRRIRSAILHLPTYNQSELKLEALRLPMLFCSFGSIWENKIKAAETISYSERERHYQDVDLTSLLADTRTGNLTRNDGILLRASKKQGGFLAIATGDSYYAPQIYEINYN